MKFAIFQVNGSACSFLNYKKNNFFIDQYKLVYSGSLDTGDNTIEDILEDIFTTFNIDHPEDFRGHSLSVSDVVKLSIDAIDYWYYCNMVGWVDITDDVVKQFKENTKTYGDNYKNS